MQKTINYRDLISGLAMIGIGLFVALYASSHYPIGEPVRMGPGFFPTMLGCLVAALGLLIALLALRKTLPALLPAPAFAKRPFFAILAAIAVFSVLISAVGLVPATFALVFIAALAERKFQLRRTTLLAAFLALLAWLVFTVALQMSLPAFMSWS